MTHRFIIFVFFMLFVPASGFAAPNPDSSSLKKEWTGETGYCNCLLVTMSRVPIKVIELASDKKLPNLEVLAASRENTLAWIRAQEFNYSNLYAEEVIKIFVDSAQMSSGANKKKTGVINVIDLVGDSGPEVERTFILELSESNGVSKLRIELKN